MPASRTCTSCERPAPVLPQSRRYSAKVCAAWPVRFTSVMKLLPAVVPWEYQQAAIRFAESGVSNARGSLVDATHVKFRFPRGVTVA